MRNYTDPFVLWAFGGLVLITNWWRKTQPIVGNTFISSAGPWSLRVEKTEYSVSKKPCVSPLCSWLWMWCFKFLPQFVQNNRLEPGIVNQRNPLLPKLLFVRIFVIATENETNACTRVCACAYTYTYTLTYSHMHINIHIDEHTHECAHTWTHTHK